MERLGQPDCPILLTLSGIGLDAAEGHPPPPIELRLTRKTMVRLENKIRTVLRPTVGTAPSNPQTSTAPRRGRISVEEIPPAQLQLLDRPKQSFRMTFSGIEPDPSGGCPPPVIELRLNRSMLEDLQAQIRAVQIASVVNAGRAATAPPLARRTRGRALRSHFGFSSEQIEQLHQDHSHQAPPADLMQRLLDGLRRMEATPS
ncbi:hypothetical protein DR950_36320 [Kitasatospora xanthocidica]|uniref:Uncharacterized protein n=1 Tax=Kitasatospora xanthocidica TaxID=83382 RepID=A0A373A2V6_9ACTN|nr:hypothetical protein [Kitasatospora xanthocidica]RGD62498.1 hypothetical protein DR950_36320 [Kitasatospora xanthocidica]